MKENKPGYKLTILGWIPVEWEVKRIAKITKIIAGATPSTNNLEYWGGDIRWMTSGELHQKRIFEVKKRITEDGLKNSSTKILPIDCVLIGLAGQGKTRGTVAITKVELCTNQSIAAILPNDIVDSEYLFSYLDKQYEQLRKLSTGDGGRGGLNLNIIGSLKIAIPPLAEQKAIAALLLLWDKAIEKTDELIKQKELLKKALMQQLLTGKKRLKGFKGAWKKYSYTELLKIVKRPVIWNDNELYKLISVRRRSGGIFLREELWGHQILVKDLRNVNVGDFIFSKMQIMHGASALVTKEFAGTKISGSYIAVIAKDPELLNIVFLKWLSTQPYFYYQTFISSYGVHIEKMTFDFESFLSQNIALPNIKEQTAIVEILETADKEIKIIKNKLEALKEQKKGLMQVLLTGKVRIK